eukprot:574973-Alexandrium_andersonii.AAC.1
MAVGAWGVITCDEARRLTVRRALPVSRQGGRLPPQRPVLCGDPAPRGVAPGPLGGRRWREPEE